MAELRLNEQRVLTEIRRRKRDGVTPSIRELMHSCGISSESVVDYALKTLEEKGLLRRPRAGGTRASRTILLTEPDAPELLRRLWDEVGWAATEETRTAVLSVLGE